MADRREALKIIGAIGTTCAFPFAAGELYGQHVHPNAREAAVPSKPKFFGEGEFKVLSRLADLIIPGGDTPGAVQAGVPLYIDRVVDANTEHQKLFRDGLNWLAGKRFMELSEQQQIEMLTPLCEQADQSERPEQRPMEVRFFRAVKSMTADGFFTSKAGLVDTLGYKGNTVLAEFPVCEVPEH